VTLNHLYKDLLHNDDMPEEKVHHMWKLSADVITERRYKKIED